MTGPYGEAAWLYWAAGWRGVLHLPVAAKWPPPSGYTGWAGIEPSGADVQTWCDGPEGSGNIALRLPDGVYGLDVDAYGSKQGGAALSAAIANLGPLLDTWVVTSRDDNTSGIRLFRAAPGVGRRWRDEPAGHGMGIEAIHVGHRYAVVWPSVHPDTGRKYRWYGPDGHVSGEVPRLDALPPMPAAWIEALSEPGEIATGEAASHTETLAAVETFPVGPACDRMTEAHGRGLDRLRAARDGAALHPAARDTTHELVRLGHEGHSGARRALAEHYAAFVGVRAGRSGGDQRAAEGEWWRLARGAVGKLTGEARSSCDCALLSGEGLLFDPGPGVTLPGGDVAASEPQGVEGGLVDWVTANAEKIKEAVWQIRIREEAREQYEAWKHSRTWTEPIDYGSFDMEGRLPIEATPWRIQGLLPAGGNALVVGPRKVGKSTIMGATAKALVEGGTFLGQFQANPAMVGWLNLENPTELQRGWVRDLQLAHPERLHLLHLRGVSMPLSAPRVRAWLIKWLQDREIEVLILDPYLRAAQGVVSDEQDNGQANTFTMLIDEIKAEAGVTETVMPAHTPKARTEPGAETARGASRLEDWADSLIYVTRDLVTGGRFIRAEGRDVELNESAVTLDPATRGLTIDLFGGSDREALRKERVTANGRAAVLAALRAPDAGPEGLGQNELQETTGLYRQKLTPIVAEMIRLGEIHVVPGPNKTRLHRLGVKPAGGPGETADHD